MITKEQIEKFRSLLMFECDDETQPYADELCNLALERLAMEPRPIVEAPHEYSMTNPLRFYGNFRNEWRLMRFNDDHIAKRPRPYWEFYGESTMDSRRNQPTHFISPDEMLKVPHDK